MLRYIPSQDTLITAQDVDGGTQVVTNTTSPQQAASNKQLQPKTLGGKIRCWTLFSMALFTMMAMPCTTQAQGTTTGGRVVVWGDNRYQQGEIPDAIQGHVSAIAAAAFQSLALLENGTVVGWGDNTWRKLNVPGIIQGSVAAIDAGDEHSLALLQDGTVAAWGLNDQNRCTVPANIQGYVIAISAGTTHNLALLDNHTVVAWGDEQLTNVPDAIQGHVSAVSAGVQHSLALLKDQTVVAWGMDKSGQLIVPDAIQGSVVAISAASRYSTALLQDGTVVAWGDNQDNQCDVPDAIQGQVTAIYSSDVHSLAQLRDGTVVSWGSNVYNVCDVPYAIQGRVTGIAAGTFHSLALIVAPPPPSSSLMNHPPPSAIPVLPSPTPASPNVRNPVSPPSLAMTPPPPPSFKISGPPPPIPMPATETPSPRAPQLSPPPSQGTAESGGVVEFGLGPVTQITVPSAALSNVITISAGSGLPFGLALLRGGTVVAWGDDSTNQIDVPDTIQGHVTAISAGDTHSLALLSNGTIVGWGENVVNQSDVPDAIQGQVAAVSAGTYHSLALLMDGTVVGWGDNLFNQSTVPDAIQGFVTAIATGVYHSLALLSNGTVVAWGSKEWGQSRVPNAIKDPAIAISAGDYHSLALLQDGTVAAWGYNNFKQCIVPDTIQGHVTAISAGGSNSLALLRDGTVVGWGRLKEVIVPTEFQGHVVAISAGSDHGLAIVNKSLISPSNRPSFVGIAIGVAAGGAACIVAAVVAAWLCKRRRRGSATLHAADPEKPHAVGVGKDNKAVTATSDYDEEASSTPPLARITVATTTEATGPTSNAKKKRFPSEKLDMGLDMVKKHEANCTQLQGTATIVPTGTSTATTTLQLCVSSSIRTSCSPTATGETDISLPAKETTLPLSEITVAEPSNKFQQQHASSLQAGAEASSRELIASTSYASNVSPPAQFTNVDAAGTAANVDVTAVVQKRVLGALRIPWSDIQLGQRLGQGGFGTVYRGAWQGNKVAVKMLNKERLSEQARTALHHEVLMMCELRHPCIAPAYGLVDDGGHQALVMRYYKRGTLANAMRSIAYQDLDLVPRLKIALQVASGISRLHQAQPRPIIHGDLKTSNILLDDDGSWRVVIADFGLASSVCTSGKSGSRTPVGMTISISPPEVLEDPCAPRTLAVDSYAFGIVLLEIVQGTPLYRGMRPQEVIDVVKQGARPAIPPTVPDDIALLIQACWAQDPAARPSIKECTEKLKASIDEHSCAGTVGHDYLNTTAATRSDGTLSWY